MPRVSVCNSCEDTSLDSLVQGLDELIKPLESNLVLRERPEHRHKPSNGGSVHIVDSTWRVDAALQWAVEE